jgi:hypothetical protein
MDKNALPDLTQTTPAAKIGPHPSWGDPEKVCLLGDCSQLISSSRHVVQVLMNWWIR